LATQFQLETIPIVRSRRETIEQQVQDLKLAATPEGRSGDEYCVFANPGKVQDCLSSQAEVLEDNDSGSDFARLNMVPVCCGSSPTEQRKFVP
jgi:hypothetical protein